MSQINSMVGLGGELAGGVLQQVVLRDRIEVDSRLNNFVIVRLRVQRGGGVLIVGAQRVGEMAAQHEMVTRWGQQRRGVFAGHGHGRVVGLADTAVIRNMPAGLCGVVPRQF
jgi:hypothetical protein